MLENEHQPILVSEVIGFFKPKKRQVYLDATLGDGGHTSALLGFGTTVIGIDQDNLALQRAYKRLSETYPDKKIVLSLNQPSPNGLKADCVLVKANFSDIEQVAKNLKLKPIDGVLFDLGVSTNQLLDRSRGFSFLSDSLDMRMDQNQSVTAADLVNALSEKELTDLFSELGDEPRAKVYARRIAAFRQKQPITKATQLAAIIAANTYRGKTHPATRVFQALRMAVNLEREALKLALPQSGNLVKKGGRLCFISFHSGEDKLVKQFILNQPNLKNLTKKPISPSPIEIKNNPRSRSAKLRVAQKI